MGNRELVAKLIKQRDSELSEIKNKYSDLLKPLFIDFTVELLNDNGWVKNYFYGAGNDWIFSKDGCDIRVNPRELTEPLTVLTYGGAFSRRICDLEDLEYFRVHRNYEE